MRKRFRWGDVQAMVQDLSAPRIDKLRRHCFRLIHRMPDDDRLLALRIHAYTYFRMFGQAFKLEFDIARGEWVLNFARAPRRQLRRPLPLLMRMRRVLRQGKRRGGGKRRGRKSSFERIIFQGVRRCGETARALLGAFSPFLTRIKDNARAMHERLAQLRHYRSQAAAPRVASMTWLESLAETARHTGARLEQRLFGESIGLPMQLSTFAPNGDGGSGLLDHTLENERLHE